MERLSLKMEDDDKGKDGRIFAPVEHSEEERGSG